MIPQNEEKINISKFYQKKKLNIIVSKKLIDSRVYKLKKRGFKMKECSTTLVYEYCPECEATVIKQVNLCRDRLCPVCNWRLSLKRYAEMLQIMERIEAEEYDCTFLTLTIKNCKPKELSDKLKLLSVGWDRLCKRKLIKENVIGWAKSIEVTYNEEKREMHPHIHVILIWKKGMYNNLLQLEIKQIWKDVLHIVYDPIIDLREIHNRDTKKTHDEKVDEDRKITKAILETFKYAVKDKSLMDMPLSDFRTFALQFTGHRLISFGGIFKEIRKEILMEEEKKEEIKEEENIILKCNRCSSTMKRYVARWSFADDRYITEEEI